MEDEISSTNYGNTFKSIGWLTRIIILINVLVFIYQQIAQSEFINKCICLRFILDGKLFRIFSSTFSHIGLKHIGVNMAGVILFSPPLEKHYGFFLYLVVNILLIIGNSLLQMLMMYFMTLWPKDLHGGEIYYYY